MELLDVNEEVQFNFNQESLICSFLLLRIFANQPKKKYQSFPLRINIFES